MSLAQPIAVTTPAAAPARSRAVWLRQHGVELAILVLALLIRFWRLGYHSIWYDEAVSLDWAGRDIDYIWRTTFALVEDKHPPIYYISLHLWQGLLSFIGLGYSDIALRAWGSLLGVLTVWGMMRLATALSGRATGRVTGLLVALSPLLTWYSQELRMFQPATTGIVWFALALWQAWHSETPGRRLAWWLLAILAIESALYSYLFSAFVLPAAGLTLLALLWQERRLSRFLESIVVLTLVGLLFLPLARNAWSVNEAESSPGQPFADFAANLLRLLRTHTVWRVEWPPAWVNGALLLFGLLLLVGLIWFWPRRTSASGATVRPSRADQVWLWLWLGVPLLIANILLARSSSIFAEDRYLLFLAPFLLWAAARGIVLLGSRWRPAGWMAGILAAAALLLALLPLWTPARAREQWRAAAETMLTYQAASPGLPVAAVTHVDYTHNALEWYLRQQMDFDAFPVFFPFGGTLTPADVEGVVAPPLNGLVDFGAHTLWLTQSHLDGVDDNRVVEGWLTQNFPLITEQYPAGIKLTGYMLQSVYDALPALSQTAVYPNTELQPGLLLAACEVTTPVIKIADPSQQPWVHVRAWWQATTPLADDYVATAQMIGPEGVWGDRLHRPTESLRFHPTSTWEPGKYMRDEIDVNLNPLTPPGEYAIVVGVMDGTGQPVGSTVECGRVRVE